MKKDMTQLNQRYFVTGTDTDAGKTGTTVCLVHHLLAQGKTCTPIKPVAAGISLPDSTYKHNYNDDAAKLIEVSNTPLPYDAINPILDALKIP